MRGKAVGIRGKGSRRRFGWPVLLLPCLLVWLLPVTGIAQAGDPAVLRGRVLDSSGAPLAAAVVSIQSVDALFRDRVVFTDRSGAFSVPGLGSGEYTVKVTKASFLPAVVQVLAGNSALLTVNLQTALDVARRRGVRRAIEDYKWVLRSSPSMRPVLRHGPDVDSSENPIEGLGPKDASGYVQVYSTAVETSAGVTDSVGSQFELTLPLARDSEVRFSGQLAEASDQPQGLGATYEFSKSPRQRSSVALNMRQGALFDNGSVPAPDRREISLEYGEQLQWSDNLVLGYGASVGRADGVEAHNYLRPEVSATWVPSAAAAVHATLSTRSPTDTTDPIRGREFFDRVVYIPAEQESFVHAELGATLFLNETVQFSATAFRDRLGTQAFLIDSDDGRRGIMIFDTRDAPSGGVRVNLNREFKDFEAGIGYTYLNAVGFDRDIPSPEALSSEASRRNVHVVTARFKADIDLTQTSVTAVYRWASGFTLTPVDPYQSFAEYNDPTLSITVAQDLPQLKALPASFQAIVDARNLFEPSFGTRRTIAAAHPQLLRGGIHIKF